MSAAFSEKDAHPALNEYSVYLLRENEQRLWEARVGTHPAARRRVGELVEARDGVPLVLGARRHHDVVHVRVR